MTPSGGAVLHCAPVVLPMTSPALRDGAVAVVDDRIVGIGERQSLQSRFTGAQVHEWPGVLLPGLVNAHTHLQYTAFADLATDVVDFATWIRTLTHRRREFDAAAWAASARDGVQQLLATGTTCVGDVVTDPPALMPVAEAGLAGVSYLEVVGMDARRWADGGRDALEAALAAAPAGRDVGIAPHSLYTVDGVVVQDCLAIARGRGLRVHLHLAETAAEDEFVRTGTGPFAEWTARTGLGIAGGSRRTPVRLLEDLGGIASDVHVAHGVHVDADDRRALRSGGVTVAVCPRSNAALRAGTPPIGAYLAEGNRLALGTDSLASSPSLDLLDEAKAVASAADVEALDDIVGGAATLVAAMTLGGARAMGRSDVGRLEAGARADLAVFDVPTGGDPFRALIEQGAGRCVATVLAGRVVHEAVRR